MYRLISKHVVFAKSNQGVVFAFGVEHTTTARSLGSAMWSPTKMLTSQGASCHALLLEDLRLDLLPTLTKHDVISHFWRVRPDWWYTDAICTW